ncbi:type II toxin-antitoxin system RelB/DinJ family antitoxin [Duganella sp. HH105]|uniref:type II toxin-antitoxin system RelB/DinJ family antitoxin n=1 Tax=Duganella sp. HH105 TaxID=1781067 RepID=UPI000877D2CE|nr:type II toxin-antitoxin system RelB/DinJ family antitoxin [Duganella sp. HH105]OEZ59919.1 antitoxin DinJ [Duganella sp. HH105]
MTEKTVTLQVQVDEKNKADAKKVLKTYGLSMSDAVNFLLHRIVQDQALPLELKVPNAETRAAIKESRKTMAKARVRFSSADELFADLEKNSES